MATNEVRMPVAAIEMQEFLYAETLAKLDPASLRNEIRKCFRFHRFALMNWLLMNGVSIPSELLTDQTHPPVGVQFPDEKVR